MTMLHFIEIRRAVIQTGEKSFDLTLTFLERAKG